MGYRSYFDLTVYDGTGENSEPQDVQDLHRQQIEDECDVLFDCEDKWYDQDDEMRSYSLKYPDLVFCINREGEESGDLEDTYYKNGKMQECYAEIVYPPYDESQLK